MSTLTAQPLADRVAIVTGASSGLGARFATVLADAGARVVAAARRLERLEELARTYAIHPVAATSRRRRSAAPGRRRARALRPARRLRQQRGGLVGRAERQATVEAFRAVLRVNLEAVFALCQAASVPDAAQGSGSVINITDVQLRRLRTRARGRVRRLEERGQRADARAGLQWATDGVRVNAIAPGWFPSEMNEEPVRGRARTGGGSRDSARWDGPVASTSSTVCCCSSRATHSYCTGQVIAVDGGWTIR